MRGDEGSSASRRAATRLSTHHPCAFALPSVLLPFPPLQVLPLVVQSLPTLGQRATYLRAFLWAMPERCQQARVPCAAAGALPLLSTRSCCTSLPALAGCRPYPPASHHLPPPACSLA